MSVFYRRILFVDLDQPAYRIMHPQDLELDFYLGGKDLAGRLLLKLNPPGADPLGPDNHLILAAGPAAGNLVWGGSRYGVFTRSPLTGGYLESYSGGRVPQALDAAGYDAVVIRGVSRDPVVLSITPQGCRFLDGAGLWGKDSFAAEDQARSMATEKKHSRSGALAIGPAGEQLIPFALIANDYWRCAGRGGAGAVMGSKKIKAMVFQGDCKRQPARPEDLKAFSSRFMKQGRNSPGVKAYKNFGTTQMVALMNNAGAFPAQYWNLGTCDHWQDISGDYLHSNHHVTPEACARCFMACGRKTVIKSGRHKGLRLGGPEYETIYAFGGLCMISDISEIVHLNDLCDRLGLDTISAGNLCALAMEAGRLGRLDNAPRYGDYRAVEKILQDMVKGAGLGKILATGIVPAARKLGLEDLAVEVKGMEPPGYDPRVLKGMGLSYAVSDRGACHLRTTFYKPELAGMIDRDAIKDKAAMVIDFENRLTIFDSLILCRFYRDMYTWEALEELVHCLLGTGMDREELSSLAAGITDRARQFNIAHGLGPKSDRLSSRLLKQALPDGSSITHEQMQIMLEDYYRIKGWDREPEPG
ncbi:MAG: aldehyde ferredoxin oxidoreductase family protein [Desulfonatronovibrionaceae bacterium]